MNPSSINIIPDPADNLDQADRETCAPDILYETGSISFNESEISFDYGYQEPRNQLLHFFPSALAHTPNLNPGLNRKSPSINSSPIMTLCIVCKSLFNPHFNPHGSCMFHKERWTFNGFPCSGSNDKSSEGCCISKHSADLKHEIETETPKLCSNCKEFGHLSKACPKDPNARSGLDPKGELERITKLKTPKLQPKNIHGKYEVDKEGFRDIEKLKAKVGEKRNLFMTEGSGGALRFAGVDTEEEEKMRLRGK